MTKLEELKAALEAARSARNVAWVAYRAELKKQQENSNG